MSSTLIINSYLYLYYIITFVFILDLFYCACNVYRISVQHEMHVACALRKILLNKISMIKLAFEWFDG